MEKLKKGKVKDSQSKVKVKCFQFILHRAGIKRQSMVTVSIDTVIVETQDTIFELQEEAERSALERIQKALLDGKPARSVSLTDFEKESIKHLCLLTMKPVIYVANVAESDLAAPVNNPHVKDVMNLASELQSGIVTVSAQVGDILLLELMSSHICQCCYLNLSHHFQNV